MRRTQGVTITSPRLQQICFPNNHNSVQMVGGLQQTKSDAMHAVASITGASPRAWHQPSKGDGNGKQGLQSSTLTATAGHRRSRSDGYPEVASVAVTPSSVAVPPSAGHRRCRSDGANSQMMPLSPTHYSLPNANELGQIESDEIPLRFAMPPESQTWTRFEKDLFLLTQGTYHPSKMAHKRRLSGNGREGAPSFLEVPGRVSIVVPTMSSRRQYHEQVWACFEAQQWIDKELIIVESYENQPSDFFLRKAQSDSRLVYVCFQRPQNDDFSTGLKRNMTLHLASGEFIVNFDDDDFYAPNYVSRIVATMQKRSLTALTLSSWYNYHVPWLGAPTCVHYNPASMNELDKEELDDHLYGFGFSYAHKRQPALLFPYPDLYWAEDTPFLLKLREMYGNHKVGLMDDVEGLCMHIVHRANSTGAEWLKDADEVTQARIQTLAVGSLPVFRHYLEKHTSSVWHSLWPLLA